MDLPAGARVGNQRGECVQRRFGGTGIGVRRRVAPCTPRRLLQCSQKFDLRSAQALNAAAAPRDAQCEGVSAPGMTRSPANVRYPGARQLAASAPPRGAGPQPGAPITT